MVSAAEEFYLEWFRIIVVVDLRFRVATDFAGSTGDRPISDGMIQDAPRDNLDPILLPLRGVMHL
jgi:hypothetical protein